MKKSMLRSESVKNWWNVCDTMLQHRVHKSKMILDFEWQYIYIYTYIHHIYIFIYMYMYMYIYIFVWLNVFFFYIKNQTDILDENGTCISNAISVSLRKCSI